MVRSQRGSFADLVSCFDCHFRILGNILRLYGGSGKGLNETDRSEWLEQNLTRGREGACDLLVG